MKKQQTILNSSLVSPLIEWYRATRRMLPWRETKDPYRIWISEIMLQQTRIEAMIPYYHRFISELPTVQALSEVSDDRLMKLWEGLGYYSRARNLKKAALQMMDQYGGALPQKFAQLRALSGIGDYTAGAISSIAYGKPEPAVDGNVLRVIMRLTGRSDDIALQGTKKAVTEWLREIYPTGADAGDLTEGLMELGEKVCIPAGIPKCAECPWQTVCVANREQRQTELPKKSPKKERKYEAYTILLLKHQEQLALQKRPDQGLLAGLWEFPHVDGHITAQEVEQYLKKIGISARNILPCGEASHIFTHITWNMTGFLIECESVSECFSWYSLNDLKHEIAIPTAFRFYLHQLLSSENEKQLDI